MRFCQNYLAGGGDFSVNNLQLSKNFLSKSLFE